MTGGCSGAVLAVVSDIPAAETETSKVTTAVRTLLLRVS
jgi:hypothetical protein